ncbi:hypothetical protein HPB49_025131 [Dermacentor silvarum]|uniref:Uncharacterized protein n=1 Tax=Dermacentor silvarum TaxID=543639 RepID=A0ACB8DH48_DERSI|nr:hypothetical protein HPB49_025131 [Dermacentor silvarum]
MGNLLLEVVSKALWAEVFEFLNPFKEANEKLAEQNVVTLPLVLMYYTKPKKHLTAASTDSPGVCKLKSRRLVFLQIKLHKIAMFLWAPFHYIRVLDEQKKKNVHDSVRELLIDEHLRLPPRERSTDQLDKNCRSDTMLQKFSQLTMSLTFGTASSVRTWETA